MFIKECWRYNKMATLVFLLFIFLWGFINYKKGAVATPILQYGMYSGRFYISDTQNVVRLFVNDKPVDFSKYGMSDRDQLQIFLEDYIASKEKNEMVFNTMQRILNKAGIGQYMKREHFTNQVSDEDFTNWYKKMVGKITGEKISRLQVFQQKYIWINGQLTAIDKPVKVTCIVD